jgi:hypothetical protein
MREHQGGHHHGNRITEQSNPPGARIVRVNKDIALHEPTRQQIGLLVGAGVLSKDRMNQKSESLHVLNSGN